MKKINKLLLILTDWAGKPIISILAFMFVILWAITGPFFHFSTEWQLFMNTVTTVVTFLMVFILQYSQNQDTEEIKQRLRLLTKKYNELYELVEEEFDDQRPD